MSLLRIGFCFVLGVALAVPTPAVAQSAPLTPPTADPAALPSQPAQPPATTTQAAPRAAARRAQGPVTEPLAPTIAIPYTTSGAFYSPQAPYYRYTTIDKEMQELMKKEADLSKKTTELVSSLKGAAADKKTELRTQLIAAVEEHFAIRQAQREHQLKRIEDEVKKLREAIEKRNTSKKEIIERRIAELTGEDTIGF
jgi:hypothetical protein